MSYKTRLLSALREKQSKEHGVHVGTVAECVTLAEQIPEDDGRISVKDRLPEPEMRVLLMTARKGYRGGTYHDVMCGFHEDGNIWREDSKCCWDYEMMRDDLYNEERDDYRVPEGWFEELLNEIDDYNAVAISDPVTHWRPLPEPPKGGK